MAPDFDINAALREEGPALVQQRMSSANVFAVALEAKEFMEQLPGRVNKLLDAVTNNEVKLKIEGSTKAPSRCSFSSWRRATPSGSRSVSSRAIRRLPSADAMVAYTPAHPQRF